MMLTKTIRTPVKARTNEEGETTGFVGYAAVFGNIDLGGDKIVKGAFAQTLASRYPDHGAGIPVYWNHDTDDPFKNLGLTTSALEDEHAQGRRRHRHRHRTRQTGRQTPQGEPRQPDELRVRHRGRCMGRRTEKRRRHHQPGYYELRRLDLYEVSICPIGMNQATEVSAKKAILGLDPDQQSEHDEKTTVMDPPAQDNATRRLRLLNLQ